MQRLSRSLKQDGETRWHSKVDMLESILNNYDDLYNILMDRGELEYLDVIEKRRLQELFIILQPFR